MTNVNTTSPFYAMPAATQRSWVRVPSLSVHDPAQLPSFGADSTTQQCIRVTVPREFAGPRCRVAIEFRIELAADEHGKAREIQPKDEDGDAGEGAIGLAVRSEPRDVK
jgi:hypothetical protein